MLPYFEFYIQGYKISIPAYTLFSCIGASIAMVIIYERILNIDGMSFKKYIALIASMGIGVALGSKALFIITLIPDIIAKGSVSYAIKKVITAGFVFYGGLTGAIVGIIIFSRTSKFNFFTISNVVCPALPAFHSFGRIGCLFAGCCYGKQIKHGFYHLWKEPGVYRIPIQLIESVFLVLITILIFWLDKKKIDIPLLYIYLLVYAIGRFIIEEFRGDILRGIWLGLSTSQWVSMIYIFLSIWGIYKWKK